MPRKRKLMVTLHLPMDLDDFATLVSDLPHTYEGGEVRQSGGHLEVWAFHTRPKVLELEAVTPQQVDPIPFATWGNTSADDRVQGANVSAPTTP